MSKSKKPSFDQELVELLGSMKFKKRLFFGVSERDVWAKIDKLNKTYKAMLQAQQHYYEGIISQLKETSYEFRDEEKEEAVDC